MRERRRSIPTVLVSAIVMLLLVPITAIGASGLPASITLEPEAAGPGETVRVMGLGFPADAAVELRLTTPSGARSLGVVITGDDGYFGHNAILPGDAAAGEWELVATAPDGTSASLLITIGAAAVTEASVAETVTAESSGNSLSDILVMLVAAVLIAGVIGAIGFVRFQSRAEVRQPGMSAGDDPIWSGKSQVADPAKAATDEPAWLTPQTGAGPSES